MADALDRLCNDSSPAITARRPPGVWALDEGRPILLENHAGVRQKIRAFVIRAMIVLHIAVA